MKVTCKLGVHFNWVECSHGLFRIRVQPYKCLIVWDGTQNCISCLSALRYTMTLGFGVLSYEKVRRAMFRWPDSFKQTSSLSILTVFENGKKERETVLEIVQHSQQRVFNKTPPGLQEHFVQNGKKKIPALPTLSCTPCILHTWMMSQDRITKYSIAKPRGVKIYFPLLGAHPGDPRPWPSNHADGRCRHRSVAKRGAASWQDVHRERHHSHFLSALAPHGGPPAAGHQVD